MAKGKSWAGAEDECLCHAWLCASEDLITGTGQKKDSFWNAIVRHFIKLLPAGELSAPEHSMPSMQARWALINKDATKFCTLMDQVHSMPWSSWTDDMYMDEALNSSSRKRGKATDGTEFCQLSAFIFTLQGMYTQYWLGAYSIDDPVCGKFLQGQVMSTL